MTALTMSAVPQTLASWLDDVVGGAPIEIDRAAAAMLRYCREHAGALREARSAQVDRALGPELGPIAAWLAENVAGDWLLPARLAPVLEDAWRIAHETAPGDGIAGGAGATAPARAAVARLVAEAMDEALGHRFVSIFRRRGEWSIGPGEAFPVVQADLKRLFAVRGSGAALVTLPDRRESPIDRTRRLALAPAADGIELALDLSQAVHASPPPAAATIAAALPIAQPTRELDWTEVRPGARAGERPRPVFHDVRPVAPTDVAARVEVLAEQACEQGCALLVFPELSIDDVALARVRAVLAKAPSPPALCVAGSRHVRAGGALRNVATAIAHAGRAGEATHAKFNPYFAGEQLEDIALVPAEVRAHGVVDENGRLAFATVMLICKDFLAPGAQRALEALRPSLVLVPAWSQKTSIFESDAVGLTGKTQAIVVIVNQADTPGHGGEDPAILMITRPVPALGPVIVRRSEVSPPELVTVRLDDEE
jgi:hypothetical protein